ncbi:5'-3' exoribonuclease, partial [Trifolium medium]|nr:5'-3' exoribonuclease [Trifolium medium]
MEDIIDNHVICAIYRLPDAHGHITRPPHGVGFPKKTVAIEDLKPEPVLWHEDSGRRYGESQRRNPPDLILLSLLRSASGDKLEIGGELFCGLQMLLSHVSKEGTSCARTQ